MSCLYDIKTQIGFIIDLKDACKIYPDVNLKRAIPCRVNENVVNGPIRYTL